MSGKLEAGVPGSALGRNAASAIKLSTKQKFYVILSESISKDSLISMRMGENHSHTTVI